jgi:cytochrome b involved in lipid metabolism
MPEREPPQTAAVVESFRATPRGLSVLTLRAMAKVVTRKVSLDEVAKHNTRDDAWIVIDNVVYDITQFGRSHPGGSIIYQYAGEDATDPFYAFHYGSGANKRLGMLRIGDLDTPIRVSQLVSDFRALRDEVERKGMMNATVGTTIHAWWGYFFLYFLALALFVYLPYSWVSLVLCGTHFRPNPS